MDILPRKGYYIFTKYIFSHVWICACGNNETQMENIMNFNGIVSAVICFVCIGAFHPIVIKAEYYLSAKCWPLFLAAGVIALMTSLAVENTYLSLFFGILGCSCFWSIKELFEQQERVRKGWYPRNPKRKK